MDKLTIRDVDVAGKRVFVRVDFNVPLADGKVTDDSRIRAALPTIITLLQAGAKVILASHLGRPDGKVTDSLRLRPVGQRLSELLRRNVPVTGDALGVGTEDAVKRLRPGEAQLPPDCTELTARLETFTSLSRGGVLHLIVAGWERRAGVRVHRVAPFELSLPLLATFRSTVGVGPDLGFFPASEGCGAPTLIFELPL